MKSRACVLFAAIALLAAPVLAQGLTLRGTVRDGSTQVGVQGLSVRLTPPRESQQPDIVTTTDQGGVFVLRDIATGRYVFEVVQGPTVVYRETVDLSADATKDVELRR